MTTATTPAEARALWVEDLRTTDEPQTTRRLHRTERSPLNEPGWCCLGRACDVFDRENPGVLRRGVHGGLEQFAGPDDEAADPARGEGHSSGMPDVVREWYGLRHNMGTVAGDAEKDLYKLNDAGASFDEIAAVIEAEPEGLLAE